MVGAIGSTTLTVGVDTGFGAHPAAQKQATTKYAHISLHACFISHLFYMMGIKEYSIGRYGETPGSRRVMLTI